MQCQDCLCNNGRLVLRNDDGSIYSEGHCSYCNTTIPTSELAALRAKAEAGEMDTARLNFILSCLNKMKLFATFVNGYHPTRSTSQQRASDEEWRISIDEFSAESIAGEVKI